MRDITDVHFKLICHVTRLAHRNRNLAPTTMPNLACGVQTVDYAVVNEVIAKGTVNRAAGWWDQVERKFHRMTVQLPPFEVGSASHLRVLLASLLSTLAQAPSLDGWHNVHTCATGSGRANALKTTPPGPQPY